MLREGRKSGRDAGLLDGKPLYGIGFLCRRSVGVAAARRGDFLLQTSMLGRLCPALCNAVTGHDNARQMINFIAQSGLFLDQLDEERNWYRYHPLFAGISAAALDRRTRRRKREAAHAGELLVRTNDAPVDAIEHALKGGDVGAPPNCWSCDART